MSEASVTFAKMAKADALTRLQYEKDEGLKLPPKVIKIVKMTADEEELFSPVKVKSKKGKSFLKKRESTTEEKKAENKCNKKCKKYEKLLILN